MSGETAGPRIKTGATFGGETTLFIFTTGLSIAGRLE